MTKANAIYNSIPVKYETQPFEDDRFRKIKIIVMHEGLNLNGSVCGMNSIEDAKESINNIPILAFTKELYDGEKDFAGHESEVVITNDGDLKYRYLGRPIGIIPAIGNDYHYEEHNGKTYVVVTGYIWTDYANEALDILERDGEKSQSMEIRIDNGYVDMNGNFNITKYRYTGLTLLGDDVRPAMVGAKGTMFSVDSTYSQQFYEYVEELKVALEGVSDNSESEVNEMENTVVNEEVVNEEVVNEEVVSNEEVATEENVVNEEFNSEETNAENVENEATVESEETTEEVVENEQDEVAVENVEVENNEPNESEKKIAELSAELSQLTNKFQQLETEVVELRNYKNENEAKIQYEEKVQILEEYKVGLTEDEIKVVEEKMNELSLSEMKSQLNEIFAQKSLAQLKAKKYSVNGEEVIMDLPKKENEKSKYAV